MVLTGFLIPILTITLFGKDPSGMGGVVDWISELK
jgi:hypothetical protein